MRYIEAEKLKKKLETLRVDPDVKSMVWSGDVEAIIDEIPEAEAVPVEWMRKIIRDVPTTAQMMGVGELLKLWKIWRKMEADR